jgi:site-specific DNA-cytosine methylase
MVNVLKEKKPRFFIAENVKMVDLGDLHHERQLALSFKLDSVSVDNIERLVMPFHPF